LPLTKWAEALPAEDRQPLLRILQSCAALSKNLAFVQRENSRGIGAREILEGTAAFFSEAAERYSLWTYFYDGARELPSYDFEAVCEAVESLSPPHRDFVADYHEWTKQLPSSTSNRQKSNLLFILQDIALDIPPEQTIRTRVASRINEGIGEKSCVLGTSDK
jgi:hypothetical protein